MDIIIGRRELNGHNRLLLVVELQLRQVTEIAVESVLATVNNNVSPLLHPTPVTGLGTHLGQKGCSHIL